MFETNTSQSSFIELTADITSAFVANNTIAPADLPSLIKSIYGALTGMEALADPMVEPQAPAVSVKKSITDDYLICLEDGRRFKSLKRHLRTKYNLSPEDYRAKWGLPKSYPMVAPSYAAARSSLAREMGLGLGGRVAKAAAVAKPAAKRGRPPKMAKAV